MKSIILITFGILTIVWAIPKGPEYHRLKELLPECDTKPDTPLSGERCVLTVNMLSSHDSSNLQSMCFCPPKTRCMVKGEDERKDEYSYSCVSVSKIKKMEEKAHEYNSGLLLKDKESIS